MRRSYYPLDKTKVRRLCPLWKLGDSHMSELNWLPQLQTPLRFRTALWIHDRGTCDKFQWPDFTGYTLIGIQKNITMISVEKMRQFHVFGELHLTHNKNIYECRGLEISDEPPPAHTCYWSCVALPVATLQEQTSFDQTLEGWVGV